MTPHNRTGTKVPGSAAEPRTAAKDTAALQELIAGHTSERKSWHWERPDPLGSLWKRFPFRLFIHDQVGLDVGSSWISYTLVRTVFGKTTLLAAGAVPIVVSSKGQLARIRAQVAALLTVRERIPRRRERWVAGISGPGTMLRTVEVPPMPTKELRKAILWEARKKFPFSLDEAHVAVDIERRNSKGPVRAVVAAVSKSMVDDFLYLLSEAEIRPAAITLPAFAMSEVLYTGSAHDSKHSLAVLDLGAERSVLAVYEGRDLEFYRELDVGMNDIIRTLSGDDRLTAVLGNVSAEQMGALLFKHGVPELPSGTPPSDMTTSSVIDAVDRLVFEVQSTLEYYAGQAGGMRIAGFRLVGGGANIPGICPHLSRALELPVEPLLPHVTIEGSTLGKTDGTPERWSLAFGYGLLSRRIPNLLPPEYLTRQAQEIRTRLLHTTTGAAVALSLLAAGGEFYHADFAKRRLHEVTNQLATTSQRIDLTGAQNIAVTVAANRQWLLSLQQPDLNSGQLLRTLGALTPEAIILDRVEVREIDPPEAEVQISGEVRTEHAQNEVVLADYIHQLKTCGIFSEVELSTYNTRRFPAYEHIVFSVQMHMELEVLR